MGTSPASLLSLVLSPLCMTFAWLRATTADTVTFCTCNWQDLFTSSNMDQDYMAYELIGIDLDMKTSKA